MVTHELVEQLTIEEAAALLHIPRRGLRELCLRGEISFSRPNYRTYLFTRRDIAEFLERRRFRARSAYQV